MCSIISIQQRCRPRLPVPHNRVNVHQRHGSIILPLLCIRAITRNLDEGVRGNDVCNSLNYLPILVFSRGEDGTGQTRATCEIAYDGIAGDPLLKSCCPGRSHAKKRKK